MSTLFLNDLYRRYLRPQAGEKEAMRVLYASTLGFGVICVGAALAMISIKSALDVWWELAGIFGGGMLGLFLLGRFLPRADGRAGLGGVAAGILIILWLTLSPKLVWWPEALRSPFHGLLVIVFGTLTILATGGLAALLSPARAPSAEPKTSSAL